MKDKIIKLKNDKKNLNIYVKCFLNGKKVNEKLANNEDFKKLKSNINKNDF